MKSSNFNMSSIPYPPTDPIDSLEGALDVILAHRKMHGYDMVHKQQEVFKDTGEPRIVYLECDHHGAHNSTSTGKRTVSNNILEQQGNGNWVIGMQKWL